jgi:hypothetical protein
MLDVSGFLVLLYEGQPHHRPWPLPLATLSPEPTGMVAGLRSLPAIYIMPTGLMYGAAIYGKFWKMAAGSVFILGAIKGFLILFM